MATLTPLPVRAVGRAACQPGAPGLLTPSETGPEWTTARTGRPTALTPGRAASPVSSPDGTTAVTRPATAASTRPRAALPACAAAAAVGADTVTSTEPLPLAAGRNVESS